MKYLFYSLFLTISVSSSAQVKYDYNWLVGGNSTDSMGIFTNRFLFSDHGLEIKEHSSNIFVDLNSASISDKEGNLLFYSNGCQVVDADGVLVTNGDSINFPSELWHNSCQKGTKSYLGTQGITILPSLEQDSLYYLFHTSHDFINPNTDSFSIHIRRLFYTQIVISNNGPLVENKNIPIIEHISMMHGYLTSCKKLNEKGWWILLRKLNDNLSYIVSYDNESVTLVDSIRIGPVLDVHDGGASAFSSDGSKYMFYEHFHGLCVFDFDRATGRISNYKNYYIEPPLDTDSLPFVITSCVFSPSGQFAYISYAADLYQVDLWASDVEASTVKIDTWDGSSDPGRSTFYQGVLGPDCNIYFCTTGASRAYHVMHSPDKKGLACDFRQGDIRLTNSNGLYTSPNFPHFRIDEDQVCDPTITSVWGIPIEVIKRPRLSPNPASDIVTSSYPLIQYQLVDISGMVVISHIADRSISEIDISGLESGIYIAKLQKQDGTWWSDKVVVMR